MMIKSLRTLGTAEVRWSRLFAAKSSDRASVHGVKQPPTHTLQDRERIEEEIEKTKEEQGKRRKEVEEKVDSQLKNSDNVVSESPESLSSS
ncbi:hypothetical protein L6452_07895 [Arctium lappa]|uniref:Uncharacterized protein n=1 Tax=Arctium lappa TaxID=4217 RepID=A0ACB9ELU2_ARCLA|nr:hypothetical protein L6452_07895 [Arctium lappa]